MSGKFFAKLENRVRACGSLLCIGLDPHSDQLQEVKNGGAEAATKFCVDIINETQEFAAAFKPNAAFFEQLGADGIVALGHVMKAIHADIPMILDFKRGDIESTAEAYAHYAFDILGADAVTLSPYMGWDSLLPFVTGRFHTKAAFVLCRTSNPSAGELQLLRTEGGETLYEQVARLGTKWNQRAAELCSSSASPSSSTAEAAAEGMCIGLVVGATDLPALRRIRQLATDSWLLCPGVGAQGGNAQDVCTAGLRGDGSGLLVSVSRGISSKAVQGSGAMAAEARRLRDEINSCRERAAQGSRKEYVQSAATAVVKRAHTDATSAMSLLKDYQREFIELALEVKSLQFGTFTLKSGRVSPYFFNAGTFCSARSLSALGRYYARAVRDAGLQFDVVFGPAYKGITLATAMALGWQQQYSEDVEVAYDRKEVKDHGEGGRLVGASVAGKRVLIVDDVITAGTAIRGTVDLLRAADALVAAVVVCLDREEKVAEDVNTSAVQQVQSDLGLRVLSIVSLQQLSEFLRGAPTTEASVGAQRAVEAYQARYAVQP